MTPICPVCHGQLKKEIMAEHLPKSSRKSGGSNDYYSVPINNPTKPNVDPYVTECNDIIENLNLTYAEANILKAIWRIAAWRNGWQDKHPPEYDSEKIQFFSRRVRIQNGGNDV